MKPKELTSTDDRQRARNIRDRQWEMMERTAKLGKLWFCVWNKNRLPEKADELRCGLIDGLELLDWVDTHPKWFKKGRWSDKRYAFPLTLTDAGREALDHRELYDMEPIHGGMVEAGWICTPLPPQPEVAQ